MPCLPRATVSPATAVWGRHEIFGRIPRRAHRPRPGNRDRPGLHPSLGADGDLRRADPHHHALRPRRPPAQRIGTGPRTRLPGLCNSTGDHRQSDSLGGSARRHVGLLRRHVARAGVQFRSLSRQSARSGRTHRLHSHRSRQDRPSSSREEGCIPCYRF